ncbi:hypothetical protein PSCICM_11130 [Pseudomonas cichorii]|uniref:Uncharacterized protein n=1 Tax=Pseudomonas cichorii TaxID=36746 RepID=A0ABQ1DSD6_PSECI|nr:hypothetical protein PSCICM_11130 [Pseudomonas cichorii]GFM93717.1 hypothetical protein PSCICP_36890 [Pseudomonas cichorii]
MQLAFAHGVKSFRWNRGGSWLSCPGLSSGLAVGVQYRVHSIDIEGFAHDRLLAKVGGETASARKGVGLE